MLLQRQPRVGNYLIRPSSQGGTFTLSWVHQWTEGPKKGQIELLHYRIESNKEKELLINGRKCTVEGLVKVAYVEDGIAPLQKPNLKLIEATLATFQQPYNEQPWFHGDLSFMDAYAKLMGYVDGTFLTHNVGYGVAMTVVLKGEPKLMHMLEQDGELMLAGLKEFMSSGTIPLRGLPNSGIILRKTLCHFFHLCRKADANAVVDYITNKGMNVNVKCALGHTPLLAVLDKPWTKTLEPKALNLAKLLIEKYNANVSESASWKSPFDGRMMTISPLSCAIHLRCDELIKLMISKGVVTRGEDLFKYVESYDNFEQFKALLKNYDLSNPEYVLVALLRNSSLGSRLFDFVKTLFEKVQNIHYTAPIQIIQEAILSGDIPVMEFVAEDIKRKGILNNDVTLCGVQEAIVPLSSCWMTNNWKRLQSDPTLKQKRLKQLQCLIAFVKKFGDKLDVRQILSGNIDPEIEKLLK